MPPSTTTPQLHTFCSGETLATTLINSSVNELQAAAAMIAETRVRVQSKWSRGANWSLGRAGASPRKERRASALYRGRGNFFFPLSPLSRHHGDRTSDSHAGSSMYPALPVSGLPTASGWARQHLQAGPWQVQRPSSRSCVATSAILILKLLKTNARV